MVTRFLFTYWLLHPLPLSHIHKYSHHGQVKNYLCRGISFRPRDHFHSRTVQFLERKTLVGPQKIDQQSVNHIQQSRRRRESDRCCVGGHGRIYLVPVALSVPLHMSTVDQRNFRFRFLYTRTQKLSINQSICNRSRIILNLLLLFTRGHPQFPSLPFVGKLNTPTRNGQNKQKK